MTQHDRDGNFSMQAPVPASLITTLLPNGIDKFELDFDSLTIGMDPGDKPVSLYEADVCHCMGGERRNAPD